MASAGGALSQRSTGAHVNAPAPKLPAQLAGPRTALLGARRRPTPSRPAHARRAAPMAAASAPAAPTWSGAACPKPAAGAHHFLHIDDFSREELLAMLDTADRVKARLRAGDESYKPFAGKTLAMIFTKPSMRTRVSFETVRFPIYYAFAL